jgi:hypothetical protein
MSAPSSIAGATLSRGTGNFVHVDGFLASLATGSIPYLNLKFA